MAFIFPYIGNNHSIWLIFFRGGLTPPISRSFWKNGMIKIFTDFGVFVFFLTYNPTSVISSATVTQDFTGQLVNPAFLMIKLPNVNHHFSWWNSVIKLPPISADSHPSRACVAQASCGARWTHHVQGFSVWLMWLGAINHPPVITILYGFHNPQMVGLWFMVYSVYHMIYI